VEPETIVKDLGHDVYVIIMPDVDTKTVFVEFNDYVIALEAGETVKTGERIVRAIRSKVPKKPIRYLVMGHYHKFYTGGLRAFVQEGTTLVTTPGNIDFLTDMATRPHTLEPDLQQKTKAKPEFLAVKGKHVFKDSRHRVEVYDIGKHTDHTVEYLIMYLPENNFVFCGDMAYFPVNKTLRKAGIRTQGLYNSMKELGLKPAHFMTSWLVKEQKLLAPFSDLETMVKMAKEEEKKK
jgi:glyoxylase-like metal-dependent hydrolase (beta-lactamase superfamily II)